MSDFTQVRNSSSVTSYHVKSNWDGINLNKSQGLTDSHMVSNACLKSTGSIGMDRCKPVRHLADSRGITGMLNSTDSSLVLFFVVQQVPPLAKLQAAFHKWWKGKESLEIHLSSFFFCVCNFQSAASTGWEGNGDSKVYLCPLLAVGLGKA